MHTWSGGVAAIAALVALVGCGSDDADGPRVELIASMCENEFARSRDIPTDIVALAEIAEATYFNSHDYWEALQIEGVPSATGDDVDEYFEAGYEVVQATFDLWEGAVAEDVERIEAAIQRAQPAAARLDAAAEDLDLDPACGPAMWAGDVFVHAATIAGVERELMTPTGDYTTDLDTFCARYMRAVRAETDIPAATARFTERLAGLQPPADLAADHAALLELLRTGAATSDVEASLTRLSATC